MPTIIGIVSRLGFIPNYLLDSNFTATNEVFTDTQVLSTSEGVQTGALRVVDNSDGQAEILNNRIKITGKSITGVDFNITGLKYETAITKEQGIVFKGIMQNSVTTDYGIFAGFRNANDLLVTDRLYQIAMNNAGRLGFATWQPVGTLQETNNQYDYSIDTDYGFAFILGGFNVDGIPYMKGADPSVFDYGCHMYTKIGSIWYLMFASDVGNDSSLYAGIQQLGSTSNTIIIDDLKLAKPNTRTKYVYDTFTDTNGILITNHTPDIGTGPWTSVVNYDSSGGSATITTEISSNQVISTTTSGVALVRNLIDCGKDDYEYYVTSTRSASGYGGHAIYFRWQDDQNYMYLYTDQSNNHRLRFQEFVGGVATTSDHLSVEFLQYTTHKFGVQCIGDQVKIFFDDVCVHSLTTTSSTGSEVGFRTTCDTVNPPSKWDDFTITDPVIEPSIKIQEPILLDTFADYGTDLTDITSHTPEIGGTWTTEISYDGGGTRYVRIESNKAIGYVTSSVSTFRCLLESGISDAIVKCTVYRGGSAGNYGTGLACRYIDANNYILLQGTNTGTISISEKVGGVTQGSFNGGSFTVGTTSEFMIIMDGRNVEIYQDGTLLTSWTATSDATGTKHGLLTLGTTSGSDSTHENFMVFPRGQNDEFSDIDLY